MLSNEAASRHLLACEIISNVVDQIDDRWSRPSPCSEWDTRGVLEHVIGFHDVLLLRPLVAKPRRPRDQPEYRWRLTVEALAAVFNRSNEELAVDLPRLVPILTTDVLVHSWDLAKAMELEIHLPPLLVKDAYEDGVRNEESLKKSGMFGPRVRLPHGSDPQSQMLALYGRDPNWPG